MYPMKIWYDELDDYKSTLFGNAHAMRIRAYLCDASERSMLELTGPGSNVGVMDGSVQLDAGAPISRRLGVTLLDPYRRIPYDPDGVDPNAVGPNSVIKIVREDYSAWYQEWYSCPLFTGPVTNHQRSDDGYFVELEGLGKEWWLQGENIAWTTRHWEVGTKITDIIRELLWFKGERKICIPDNVNRTLRAPLSLMPDTDIWAVIKTLAARCRMVCMYDGDGWFRMHHLSLEPVVVLKNGEDGNIFPGHDGDGNDNTQIVNGVFYRGGLKTEDSKEDPVYGMAKVPSNSPISPARLGRNGANRYMYQMVSNTNIRSALACAQFAKQDLRIANNLTKDKDVTALPFPPLEEYDVVRTIIDGAVADVPNNRSTQPLTPGGVMSVGVLRAA